jgi:hypothetical protein
VGFENQSFSSQIANRIRHLLRFYKPEPSLTPTNLIVRFQYSFAGKTAGSSWPLYPASVHLVFARLHLSEKRKIEPHKLRILQIRARLFWLSAAERTSLRRVQSGALRHST